MALVLATPALVLLLRSNPTARTTTFRATAGATIQQAGPDSSYVGLPLRVGPQARSYVKFSLSGLSGAVIAATLSLVPEHPSTAGFAVHRAASSAWNAGSITWNSAPPITGPVVSSPRGYGCCGRVSVDVTPLVYGNGTITLVLTSTATPYDSYHSSAATAPELIVTTSSATPAPSNLNARTLPGKVTLSWSDARANGIVAGYRVYRDGVELAQTGDTGFTDTRVVDGMPSRYYVVAYSHTGRLSPRSAVVSAAAPPLTTIPACGSARAAASFGPGSWPVGCWRPYADSSPYNQPLPAPSATPVAGDSAQIVDYMLSGYGSSGFSPVTVSGNPALDTASNWDHPVYWAHPGDPAWRVSETEYPGNNNGQTVLIPNGARHALGSDGHLTVIQPDGTEEDFWQVHNPNPLSGGGTLSASAGGSTPLGGSGCCTNSTAANQALAAGLIRGQELQAGVIDHALVVSVRCDNGSHVYPATGDGSVCPNPANAPAEGQRLQLNMTDGQVDGLAIPAYRKIILKAMIHYGFYITDTGGSPWDLEFEPALDYTSYGYPNPLLTYLQAAGLTTTNTYTLDLNSGVDWSKLQVVNPCYTQHTC